MLKLDYDITKSTFKYVESLWFNYKDMIKKMRDIEIDVTNDTDLNEDIRAKGLTSDPTSSQVFKLDYARQNKQYRTLEDNVKAIEDVLNSLPNEYVRVARARYMSRPSKSWYAISDETGYSERHARRIRDMIVTATAERLGLW